ncbi:MAG: 2-C-methyl-D-erythritol 4-phosphate cytidylyltransferase [Terriglobales bacterium]
MSEPKACAIIPAAGLSTRMGSTTAGTARKQLLEFRGAPLLLHTLRKFDRCPGIQSMLVPVRPEDRDRVAERILAEPFRCPVRVLEGGESRQQSVWNALQLVDPDTELVAVHDAVRPFVTPELITRALEGALRHGAVILGVPAVDTLKQVARSGNDIHRVESTVPRERIVLAQTPQVFRYELLCRAFAHAQADGFYGTDESALVEHFGHDVFVVPGSTRNWKITAPSDLALAEVCFGMEEEEAEGRL